MERSNFFSVLVIGDNPDELINKYDKAIKVEPYVKFRYNDASKLKKSALSVVNEMVNNPTKYQLTDYLIDYFKERKKVISSLTDFEYYQLITEGLYYDKNGDALSEENPNGKWSKCSVGKNFSMPFITLEGKETYSAKMSDIDWSKIHMNNESTYEIVWDLVHDNRTPHSEEEEKIYNTMKDRKNYFSNFKDKEEYVLHNCAYWNYAVVDEKGWHDLDDSGKSDMEWVANFYDKYIKHLKKDTTLTIYECSK